jgi:carboxylesterase
MQTIPNDGKRGLNWEEQRKIHITYDRLPLAKTRDLQKIIHRAMKSLPSVTCPALIIQSKGDEVIPQNSAESIFKGLGSAEKAKRIYQDSNHLIIKDHDRDAVASDIISFFTR